MILRVLTFAGGLAGAVTTSQFPEFSQQYVQRLGGAVDALSEVVADFDASAAAEGLSREAALAQMSGTAFIERRRHDMTRTFTRFGQLQQDLAVIEGQGPFMRAYSLPHMADREIARAAWAAYQPALPFTLAGAILAAVGFVMGGVLFGLLLKALVWPFRRRGKPAETA